MSASTLTPTSDQASQQEVGECDLSNITGITICGIVAPILTQTVTQLTATVPAGAAGVCPVVALSTAGAFTASLPLVVQ
jgi:hypothetical protein